LESQSCQSQVACLHPFSAPGLVRYLSTHAADHLPPGLTAFASDTDRLGQTYLALAGPDNQAGLRAQFRNFLLEHLGAGQGEPSPVQLDLAERLYTERDWMVPDPESSQGRLGSFSRDFEIQYDNTAC